jgi:hypothetical protein
LAGVFCFVVTLHYDVSFSSGNRPVRPLPKFYG